MAGADGQPGRNVFVAQLGRRPFMGLRHGVLAVDQPPALALNIDGLALGGVSRQFGGGKVKTDQFAAARLGVGVGHSREQEKPLSGEEKGLVAVRAVGEIDIGREQSDHRRFLETGKGLEDAALDGRKEGRDIDVTLFESTANADVDDFFDSFLGNFLRDSKRDKPRRVEKIEVADRSPEVFSADALGQVEGLFDVHQRLIAVHESPLERIVGDVGVDRSVATLGDAKNVVVAVLPDMGAVTGDVVLQKLLEAADELADVIEGVWVAFWPGKAKVNVIWHDHRLPKGDEAVEIVGGFDKIALGDFAGFAQNNAVVVDLAEPTAP